MIDTPNQQDAARWRSSLPPLTGRFDDDIEVLTSCCGQAERWITSMPARPARDGEQQRTFELLQQGARRVRDRFVNLHADAIYDQLTAGRSLRLRLDELVEAAAREFTGLVPTQTQLDRERDHQQADKDGHEIDQGIFFRGLLRSPSVGEHLIESMLMPSTRAGQLRKQFRHTGHLDLGAVDIERRDGAAWLTINNQHCLNAEDDRLVNDLETAIDLALLDDEVVVGVLRGGVMTHPRYRGRRVFSAGINLADLRDGKISFVNFLLRREFSCLNKIAIGTLHAAEVDRFPYRTVEKPWIAAVDSFAIGGGMQLLLVFDRVLAAQDAFFSLPAAQEGIVPGAANLRLSRLTGPRLARRIILGGQSIRATDPEALLVCDEVVPADQLDAALARAVAEYRQPAVAANRRMLGIAEETTDQFRSYMAEFSYAQAVRLYSEDVIAKVDRHWSRPDGPQ